MQIFKTLCHQYISINLIANIDKTINKAISCMLDNILLKKIIIIKEAMEPNVPGAHLI